MSNKKLYIIASFILIINTVIYSEELYYYGFEQQIPMRVVTNKVALYHSDNTEHQIDNFLAKHNLIGSWRSENLCIVNNSLTSLDIDPTEYNHSQDILYLPVYVVNNEIEIVLLPEVVLKPNEIDYNMTELVEQYNMELLHNDGIYQIYSIPNNHNSISVANAIYETGDFIFAYPNFYTPFERFAYIPNDTYFNYQFSCNNIGQLLPNGHTGTFDADIDAPEAWEITRGSSDIVVAVLDLGVTSNHPDLPNSRQVRLCGSNFGNGDPNDPSPQGNDNHGNACAGVIAATMDNNEGIAGIAPNCKIMPLRWSKNTNINIQLSQAIKFAADNGANILSCSFGVGSSNPNFVPAIVTALEYAISRGVVIVFAAGNDANHHENKNGIVQFPANANINSLITVGATDRFDKLAVYSPTGPLIDVTAPSHRAYNDQIQGETLEMWTLDIPDVYGINPKDGVAYGEKCPDFGPNHLSYTGRFGGTSYSCPVVAGVVALMLSVNPRLSPEQVFFILTATCDKVGDYLYINGKSNELGYGRVNAHSAVLASQSKYIQNYTYKLDENITELALDITAGHSINCQHPQGAVIIDSASNVIFRAMERVTLKPGFHAKKGSRLHIHVDGLITSNISSAPQRMAARSSSATTDDTESTNDTQTNNTLEDMENNMIQSTTIYTISGQLIQTISGGQRDVAHLSNGMYILQHRMSDGSVRSEKRAKN